LTPEIINMNPSQLDNNSKIAIIGGGPAGAFFALYLKKYAEEKAISPEITIYEQRDFNCLGRQGCKGCAGILSATFSNSLAELGLQVPAEIVQTGITHYTVHSPYTSISVDNPAKETPIVSIYRGGGPLLSNYGKPISFNEWLLSEVRKHGVKVVDQAVSSIFLEPDVRIKTANDLRECDMAVLATGVNGSPVEIKGLHYVPPATQIMTQCELYSETTTALGNTAHVFLIPHSSVIFGTLVPKGPFINVSVLNRGNHPYPIKDFLDLDLVRQILPEHYEYSCSCHPKVAVGLARNFYSDRFVAIGDAAISRLYKDGIGSSLLTAREAARTIIYEGVSRTDFQRHYYPFCRSIYRGNRWGRLLFFLNDKAKNSRAFLLAQNRLIGNEQANIKRPQPFTKAAWGMFTGSSDYRSIARMSLNPVSLAKLIGVSTIESVKGLRRRDANPPRRLYVGNQKILILGSGFGGTFVFRHLLPSLNRNENVETTMISDENFFLFTPLLHEVAMGKIETRHVAFPIRRLNWKDRFDFIQDKVQNIDIEARKVTTAQGVFDYDYLVLALGSVTDTSSLGSMKNSNVFTLKTLHDSMVIRNHIIGLFERAAAENNADNRRQMLTFIVGGAGYTGVQLVTELRDFVYRHLVRFYRSIKPSEIRIILVEAEPKILAGLPARLSAYALEQLKSMNIELRLNSRVTDVRDSRVEVNNSEYLSTRTLIWVAGIAANPLIAGLNVKKDSIGRVLVNQFLEVPEARGVYAIGDCAHFDDPVSGLPVPPRAHNAVRQARVAAHNILAEIRGWDKKPYHYSNTAEVVSLGASNAVARFYNIRFHGFLARLIWIAGYSLLVTGTYNRIRILTDWGLSLLFGRDTTFLNLDPKDRL
jgi:NADH dehydrogenase